MVTRIKKKRRRPRAAGPTAAPNWYVPFDAEGTAAVFIHKHGDGDDHSACGPVVMCCERAQAPYAALAPDLCARIHEGRRQRAEHLVSWLDGGVQAMYFVLCDPDDPRAIYQFGLPADEARKVLTGRIPLSHFRRPDLRFDSEAS